MSTTASPERRRPRYRLRSAEAISKTHFLQRFERRDDESEQDSEPAPVPSSKTVEPVGRATVDQRESVQKSAGEAALHEQGVFERFLRGDDTSVSRVAPVDVEIFRSDVQAVVFDEIGGSRSKLTFAIPPATAEPWHFPDDCI